MTNKACNAVHGQMMDTLSRHSCCFSSLVLAPLQVARAPRLVGSVSRCRLLVLPRLGLGTLLGRLCLASAWFGFGLGLGLGFGFGFGFGLGFRLGFGLGIG